MKIKRLTAALAVAAMAAGFTLASPMLSAHADVPTVPQTTTYAYTDPIDVGTQVEGSATAPTPTPIDLTTEFGQDNAHMIPLTLNHVGPAMALGDVMPLYKNILSGWSCTYAVVADANGIAMTDDRLGSATCDKKTGKITYTPAIGMGVGGDAPVLIYFSTTSVLDTSATGTYGTYAALKAATGWYDNFVVNGYILVTVTQPKVSSGCDFKIACLSATLQAWGKGDKQTTASVSAITSNINTKNAFSLSATQASTWGLVSIDNPSSIDQLTSVTLNSYVSMGAGNKIVFAAPKNWSGTVTYQYTIAPYPSNTADFSNYPSGVVGSVTFIVQPTLPAIDDLSTDVGVPVTIPVLSQAIIGSAPFQDANCVFASGRNKTSQTAVGTIVNKGGSKNPVFTPADGFTGDVTLSCTVADKWDPISNAVSVVIHVGAPAPAPVAPTTAAPACTTNCGNSGTLVSTGGSLAAPMSSGLAAVVLLVAAGAGILVVRRRTSLAG